MSKTRGEHGPGAETKNQTALQLHMPHQRVLQITARRGMRDGTAQPVDTHEQTTDTFSLTIQNSSRNSGTFTNPFRKRVDTPYEKKQNQNPKKPTPRVSRNIHEASQHDTGGLAKASLETCPGCATTAPTLPPALHGAVAPQPASFHLTLSLFTYLFTVCFVFSLCFLAI